jgi:CubicO group peptidase (beta-lactamase class C family)
MITPLPPKFKPGARFGYSNAGFILLGLAVEAAAGISYRQFVRDMIIKPCGLEHTGFYRMDALPENTAFGYIYENGERRANIFKLPVLGGSDGGIYTCAGDLDKLWRALFSNKILPENMLEAFLKPQAIRSEKESYGLGVYRHDSGNSTAYYAVGGDFGVDFFTAYFPGLKIAASALGNTEINAYPLMEALILSLHR